MVLSLSVSLTWGKPPAEARRPPPLPKPGAATIPWPDLPPQAQAGWSIRDALTGEVLEDMRGGQALIPASTLKLFTTWAALDVLGPERTFPTELHHLGTLEKDLLKGDLVIKGFGDPGFASAQLAPEHSAESIFGEWLRALQQRGVKRMDACVRGDGSYLELEGPHPASLWEDAGNYYAGTASGLCFNDNLYALIFSGAARGRSMKIKGTLPSQVGIATFINRVRAGPTQSEDSAFIFGGFPSPVRVVSGSYPARKNEFAIKGSLPNPPWTCAREFQSYLIAHGIPSQEHPGRACPDSLPGDATPEIALTPATLVARHVSAPLKELVRHTNQKSDNNYAAQFLALLGREAGQSPDCRGGVAALYAYLGKRGFDLAEIHLKDGNGLSRSNWISPSQTSKLLSHARKQKAFPEFKASLVGSPGSEGKLGRYGPGWGNRLWVKTGTLEGVSAAAGYLQARSGRLVAFAATANNFDHGDADPQRIFAPLFKAWADKY